MIRFCDKCKKEQYLTSRGVCLSCCHDIRKAKKAGMTVQVYRAYNAGAQAGVNDCNPYSPKYHSVEYHAWSGGHFDRHGRVAC